MKTAAYFGSLLVVGVLLQVLQPAHASCVWQWDCTGGQCRQVPICNSTLDIPPVEPARIAPIPAPTIPPISSPMVPPVGTSQCAPRYFCEGGACQWRTVCQ